MPGCCAARAASARPRSPTASLADCSPAPTTRAPRPTRRIRSSAWSRTRRIPTCGCWSAAINPKTGKLYPRHPGRPGPRRGPRAARHRCPRRLQGADRRPGRRAERVGRQCAPQAAGGAAGQHGHAAGLPAPGHPAAHDPVALHAARADAAAACGAGLGLGTARSGDSARTSGRPGRAGGRARSAARSSWRTADWPGRYAALLPKLVARPHRASAARLDLASSSPRAATAAAFARPPTCSALAVRRVAALKAGSDPRPGAVRRASSGCSAGLAAGLGLDQWVAVWDKLSALAGQVDRLNLDPVQALLQVVQAIGGAAPEPELSLA